MAVNRAEFSVAVKSTFDSAGIDAAKGAYAALAVQLKAMQADIAQAQRTGVAIPQSALDEISKLEHSIANLGHVSEETGVKAQEVKEALHLVRDAAGNALGPLGQLAHFLENPYVLAAAGAIAAIHMLAEQYEALRQNTLKNIIASQEQTDQWRSAFVTAANEASAAMNNYAIKLAHARDQVDLLAEAQHDQVQLAQQHATAVEAQADAQERLNTALIHEQEILGHITPPEAAFATEQAHRAERTAREHAADTEAQAEIDSRRRQASAEREIGREASARLPGDQAAAQHAATMLGGVDIPGARQRADDAAKNLAQAETNAELPSADQLARAAGQFALHPGGNYFNELLAIQATDLATAKQQQEVAKNYLAAQIAKQAQYQEEVATAQANRARDEELALAKQLLYESIMREVEAARTRLADAQRGRAAVDRAQDATYTVTRRTELEKKLQDGSITAAERGELQGMTAIGHGRGGVNPLTHQYEAPQLNAQGRPNTLEQQAVDAAYAAERGAQVIAGQAPASVIPAAFAELQRQHGILIGLLENPRLTDPAVIARLQADDERIRNLEARQNARPNL